MVWIIHKQNISGISYKSMVVFDVWLLLYISYPGLFNKTDIQDIYNAIRRKIKPG